MGLAIFCIHTLLACVPAALCLYDIINPFGVAYISFLLKVYVELGFKIIESSRSLYNNL